HGRARMHSPGRAAVSEGVSLAAALEGALAAAGGALALAASQGSLREESLAVAGLPVRLRIAAPRFGPTVDLALAHLSVAGSGAPASGDATSAAGSPPRVPGSLTILVVDESEGFGRLPPEVLRGAGGGAGGIPAGGGAGGAVFAGHLRAQVDLTL